MELEIYEPFNIWFIKKYINMGLLKNVYKKVEKIKTQICFDPGQNPPWEVMS